MINVDDNFMMAEWIKMDEKEPPLELPVAILTECGSFDCAYMDSDGDFHGSIEDFYPGDSISEWLEDDRNIDLEHPMMLKAMQHGRKI